MLLPLWLQRTRQTFLDLIFPPRCRACDRFGDWFCAACISQLDYLKPPWCQRCGQAVAPGALCSACQRHPLPTPLTGLRAVAHHGGALRKAIHALKYERLSAIAEPLGMILCDFLKAHPIPHTLIVPVPLHHERQLERGYNQSALLAQVLQRESGQRLDTQSLLRQRHTRPQVGLNEAERRQNLVGAFECVTPLKGEQILLVDDVCTTSATLSECAQALHAAGAVTIWGLTLAR